MTPDRSQVTRLTGVILCCLGLYVLAGWITGSHSMVRIVPDSVAMSINTALLFFICGTCLLLKTLGRMHGKPYLIGSWLIIALAGTILSEHLFNIDLPIDLAFVHDALGDGHAKPGRTAPNACMGFLFAGMVFRLVASRTPGPSYRRIGMTLAALTLIIGSTALLGYLLHLDAMYQIAAYNRMATFTAVGILTLGVGLWTLHGSMYILKPHGVHDDAQRITKLAAVLLMVFAIATGLMSFAVFRDSFEKGARDNHMNTAKSTAFSISSLLDQMALLSASVARRPAIVAPLSGLAGERNNRSTMNELKDAARIFTETGFSAARILSADNSVIFSAGHMDSDAISGQVRFGGADDASYLRWSGGFLIRNSHRLVDDGRHIATIITEHRLATLNAFIGEARQASPSTDVLICPSTPNSICFPSRIYPSGAVLKDFKRDSTPALPGALLGRAGSAVMKDPRAVAVLAGFAPLPRHGMSVLVKTDANELYIPLRDKLHLLLGAVLLFVMMGSLLLRRWVQPLIVQIVEERQRIKAILNNANDAFIAIGPDGKVTDFNMQAEKTLGMPAEDALGRDLAELIVPERHRHGHNAGFAQFLSSGRGPVINSRVELTALHASGDEIPVELSVTAFPVGKQFGASAFLRDLTERKKAEASAAGHQQALEAARSALNQSQKLEAVGKLTGGVAHDFNNVLQVVKGSLELLRQENDSASKLVKRVDTAMSAVDRGAKLAAQLLAFARKQPLQPKACNLGRVVRGMADMLQRAIGDAIEIEIVVAGGLWNTLVDQHQMEHVVLNLAINARDAMDGNDNGNRQLTIELGNASLDEEYVKMEPGLNPGQFVMLAISDTGAGMTADTIAKAFEPFFSTKPEGQGTGLGLSMTYGFVKQSDGHIKIYSELGHGTTVRIYLPRSFEQERLEPAVAPDVVVGGSETILVVEDDMTVQATVVDLLLGLGYTVLRADNAAMALEIIEKGAPIDLLFTDVVMPGELRSPELARRAKEILPALQVLFTSGYTQNAIVHGGRLDPGVHLLSKPYGREQLGRKVRSLLSLGVPAPVTAGARVMFIEDNEDFRSMGTELIAVLGHQVESFGSAEEALARGTSEFDVLLTDIGLPGMSGLALARIVRQNDPDIRIILASGYGDSLTSGTDSVFDVLPKPFTIEQLKSCLDAATATSESRI